MSTRVVTKLMKIYITIKQQPRRYAVLWSVFVICMCFAPFVYAEEYPPKPTIPPTTQANEKEAWTGIDVSVVGKYATQYGRPPRDPYINTDRGDLLLFVFTLAGVAGGFVMGFNARKLFYEK